MPAPKGSSNGKAAWYVRQGEEKSPISARIPKSIAQQLEDLLEPDESRSDAILKAIELLIKARSKKLKAIK